MSEIIKLRSEVMNLNKRIEAFRDVSKIYRRAIGQVSQNIHESLNVLLQRTQCISGMAYQEDFHSEPFENVSLDVFKEVRKLAFLSKELQILSGNKVVWSHRLKM